MDENSKYKQLIEQSEVQMRKGMLMFCVLLLCRDGKVYSSQIITRLRDAQLIVVEGTLYPLLSRLARDRILGYEWRESDLGPPRKYYWLTEEGGQVLDALRATYQNLDNAIKTLEKKGKS